MSDSKGLISAMTRKWKLEQIPSKKLEIENKLMEERLNQLKTELNFDKTKRNAVGGTIWSKAQPGPVTQYGKNIVKNDSDSILMNKMSNRQIKLQVLKDDYLQKQNEKISQLAPKEKKLKCGQCEKNLAFTRCLECCEDYCANCFTSFHMKGALQKHRTVPITANLSSRHSNQSSRPQSSDTRNEDNESIYDITSNRSNSNSAKKKVEFSLFDGHYDEKEAQDSFQQALAEWRSASKNPKKTEIVREERVALTSRDAGVETNLQPYKTNQILDLENKIGSHALSYAERMLLQKYRRNDLDVAYTPRSEIDADGSSDSVRQSMETPRTSHLNFNSIIQALQGGRENSFINTENDINMINYIQAPVDLKPTNNFIYQESRESTVIFEEVENSQKYKSLNLNLEPDLIEIKSSIRHEEPERPKSAKSTNRLNSARVKSARPKSSLNSVKFEENLNREPTSLLKSIAKREVQGLVTNDIGDFLMLDVNGESKETKKETPRVTSARPQTTRVDPKLYAMSPRSWVPFKSHSENLTLTISVDSEEKQEPVVVVAESPLPKSDFNGNDKNETNNRQMSSRQKSKNQIPKNPVNVTSSANFETKKVQNKTIKKSDYDRAKSFVLPKKSTKLPHKNNRPVSASHNFDRPTSRMNYEFADRFSEYDVDDGRSSRICQNEEDNSYFGMLVNEYKSSIITQISDLNDTKLSQSNVKDLTDSLNKSLSNLELTMRNDEYDDEDDDLESLALEELRSLK